MNWIRIARKIASSATVQRVAEACKVRRNEAQGAIVSLLCALPDHARDGDISDVPDRQLEKWADWEGKPGTFAVAFRAEMCTDGLVSTWEEHNGTAIRRADDDKERKEAARAAAKSSADRPQDKPPTQRRPSAPTAQDKMRDVTGRDVKEEERGREPTAPPSSSAGLSAEFSDPSHAAAYRGARRSARNPETFDAMLQSLASGLGAPRGKPLTWHQIGTAILQIAGQPAPPPLSANVIGGYAVKIPVAPVKPALSFFRDDLPGTIRDAGGLLIWHPGQPAPRPSDDEIAGNGWSVAA